jgi:hypothetical protein
MTIPTTTLAAAGGPAVYVLHENDLWVERSARRSAKLALRMARGTSVKAPST